MHTYKHNSYIHTYILYIYIHTKYIHVHTYIHVGDLGVYVKSPLQGKPCRLAGLRHMWFKDLAQGTHADSNPLPFYC